MKDKFKVDLANMFKAKFSLIYITTWEESRLIEVLRSICNDESLIKRLRTIKVWSSTTGFDYENKTKLPMEALNQIQGDNQPGVYVLKDFHYYIDSRSKGYDFNIIRKLRDLVEELKFSDYAKSIVIVSPITVVPLELQKDITILEFNLPDIEEIKESLEEIIESNKENIEISLNEEEKVKLSSAALGLTLQEAENAFAKAMVEDGKLQKEDIKIILNEKKQIIKKTGVLEYISSQMKIGDIGGLENLKRWLYKRERAWDNQAIEYGLNAPKGILITGVPGCGKSLTAKAVGAMWNMPLLRMDIGSVLSGLVGSSEENMRRAIKTAEALAPSILWIDEIEKGFSGVSGSGDSGVSTRIFGTFLTWMQEKKSSVFVIATANNISSLPPEFMRKGRFDEIFFVDIPTRNERMQILKIHLEKRLKDEFVSSVIDINDELLLNIADKTEGFVGAELEEVVVSGLFEAFSNQRPLSQADLELSAKNMIPLSVTQHEQITAIRQWADIRAVSATAKDALNDYEGQDSNVQINKKIIENKETIERYRGGRTIEF